MSDDAALMRDLAGIGLHANNYRAVCLLPLVEVAWADGGVQERERALIVDIARGHDLLGLGGLETLQRWLATRPDDATFQRGRELLVRLALRKTRDRAVSLPDRAVESVVEFCTLVAESAGGLFDTWWTVSSEERVAIRQIAEHLDALSREAQPRLGIVGHSLTPEWDRVIEDLDGNTEEV